MATMWAKYIVMSKLYFQERSHQLKNILGSAWTLVSLSYVAPRIQEQTYLCDEVEDCIGEHIDSRPARYYERVPPPMVILQDISIYHYEMNITVYLNCHQAKTILSSCILGPFKYYKCVRSRVYSVSFKGSQGVKFPEKNHYVTLESPV